MDKLAFYMMRNDTPTNLQMLRSGHSLVRTQKYMIHIKFVISGECSILTIIINKALKKILQKSKGMACCVVLNKAF